MKLQNSVITKFLPVMLLAAFLSGCNDDTPSVTTVQPQPTAQPQQVVDQPVQQQEPQVVYVQQEPQQPQVVYEQAPQQPVIVNQQPQYDSSGNLLTGMMLGHMMANSGRSGYSSNHTTVNKTVVNKTYVQSQPRKVYYGSQSVPRRTVSSFTGSSRSYSSPVRSSPRMSISTKRPTYYRSRH